MATEFDIEVTVQFFKEDKPAGGLSSKVFCISEKKLLQRTREMLERMRDDFEGDL